MRKNIFKILITVLILISLMLVVIVNANQENDLTDIDNHWSKQYVSYLVNKGAINGYPDGTFRPENSVTYAEAIKLIVASYNKGIEYGQEHWATNYVEYGKQTGIVPKNMVEMEDIDKPISRKEVMYMVYQSLTEYAKKPVLNNDRAEIDLPFEDLTVSVNEYGINYYEAIRQSYYLGILTGDDTGLMNPEEDITRAEMATILTRAYSEEYRQYPSARATAYLPSNAEDYEMILAYMPNSFYEVGSDSFAKYKKGGTPSVYLRVGNNIDGDAKIIYVPTEIFNVSYEMTEEEWNKWKESINVFMDVSDKIMNDYIQYVKDNKIEIRGGVIINPCTFGEMEIIRNKYQLALKGMLSYEIISKDENAKYVTIDEYMYEKIKLKTGNENYIILFLDNIGDKENIILGSTLGGIKYEEE